MIYVVKKRTINPKGSLQITQHQFDAIRSAREGSLEVLAIEEKFNILLENYAEFEKILLNVSLRRMLFASFEWSHSINELHDINRALVNLLSTCRLYLDQIPHNLLEIFEADPNPREILRHETNIEYDNHLGYRVMEAMRNYSQHRALPLHQLENGIKMESGQIKHYVKVSVDVEKLAEDQEIKRAIVNELKALGQYVDVKPLLREYLECFMRLHKIVRDLVKDKGEEYRAVLFGISAKYRNNFAEEPTTLGAFAKDDAGKTLEEIPIFTGALQRWELLVQKNQLVLNLSRHFVTNQVQG
jgi:hypothetical protein